MPQSEDDLDAWVRRILQENKNLNFVQRILEPKQWPTMTLPSGHGASHLMSWAENEKGPFVYPTIIYDKETRSLKQLEARQAVRHALSTGEFIPFPDAAQADLFSKEYKRVWGKQ